MTTPLATPAATSADEIATLRARIEALETAPAAAPLAAPAGDARRHRRIGLIAGLVAGLSLGGGLVAATAPGSAPVLETRRLQIVDDAGRLVAAFGSDERGGRLDLWTGAGRNIIRLGANEHGGDLNLWDAGGGAIAGVWATADGGRIAAWDPGSSRSVELSATGEATAAQLVLGGDDGSLTLRGGAAAGVGIASNAGRADLGLSAEGGRLSLHGTGDEPALVATAAGPGDARLRLGGPGASRLSLAVAGRDAGLDVLTDRGVIRVGTVDDGVVAAVARPDQRDRVQLAAGPTSPPSLDVLGGLQPIARLGQDPRHGGSLRLFGVDGETAAAIAARDGAGLLNLFNDRQVAVVKAGVNPAGRGGAIAVHNARGLAVVEATSTEGDDGRLAVADKDAERARVMAPTRP